jgi:hypothetical protein
MIRGELPAAGACMKYPQPTLCYGFACCAADSPHFMTQTSSLCHILSTRFRMTSFRYLLNPN